MTRRRLERVKRAVPQLTLGAAVLVTSVVTATAPDAHADNKRLNNAVAQNVYTIQHQAGCITDLKMNPQLQLAAQWHTNDVLNDRNLDGDIGSDGSTPQDRANAAGFHGKVAQTVAINPALAISGIELMNQWYYNPAYMAIMQDCANTVIGVWSENSLDRTVVVAVYGQPA
ncbi:CAP domain-containing protein [Mycolicibacterium sp. P9-64]|nr:CAP domain-containing protein [Mycolicibacterium sp. P9-64]